MSANVSKLIPLKPGAFVVALHPNRGVVLARGVYTIIIHSLGPCSNYLPSSNYLHEFRSEGCQSQVDSFSGTFRLGVLHKPSNVCPAFTGQVHVCSLCRVGLLQLCTLTSYTHSFLFGDFRNSRTTITFCRTYFFHTFSRSFSVGLV